MEKFGRKILIAGILSALLLSGTWAAMPERLIPGGDTIGLELDPDGVSVVELSKDCSDKVGFRSGDLICKINGGQISSVQQLRQAVQASGGKLMEIAVIRNGEEKILL